MPPSRNADAEMMRLLSELSSKVGELTGQIRELIHQGSNNAMKLDALAVRVAALEAAEQRRVGASGVVALILKSPALGWFFLAAVTLWAFLTGKVRGT